MPKVSRQFGSVLMIIGSEVGGGVLALPILIFQVGVWFGSIILIFMWALTLYTALLCCEATDALEGNISYATMAETFLGKSGKAFVSVTFWFSITSIVMAYISAAGATFNHLLSIPASLSSAIFVIVFGICVVIGIKIVDYVNRLLLSLKLLAFIIAIIMLGFSLKLVNLTGSVSVLPIISALPAITTAFILHCIIPAIRAYLDYDKKALKRVVIIGSLIPLVLYILWITTIIGNIPEHGLNSFDVLIEKGKSANIGDVLSLISLNGYCF